MAAGVEVMFLRDVQRGGAADQPQRVAQRLVDFVAAAAHSLDVAIYDFRLSDQLAGPVVGALREAADRGVVVRIAFDAGKPAAAGAVAFARLQADPAPVGTAEWVRGHFAATKVATRAISAPSGQLMHSKYLVRDVGHRHAAVWTGSANFTDDAWTRQENNLLTIISAELARAYRADFDQLWAAASISGSDAGDAGHTSTAGTPVGWDFAPADGPAIDGYLTAQVSAAASRIMIASMVLTSHPLLAALAAAIGRGLAVAGIYDAGQMDPIEQLWTGNPHDTQVLADWHTVKAALVGKPSTPYTPTGPHDFMHNKILLVDRQVITGSYNLSGNAQHNAENQLRLTSKPLADQYQAHITAITEAYRG
jgi:phosphatidylserine/phosphatidylglycerophosphate/cardiolipin synthase-like enzyme